MARKVKDFALLGFLSIALFGCSSHGKLTLQESVGNLVLSHDARSSYQNDQNPFGSAVSYDQFRKTYQSDIQKLSQDLRIQYFWFAMWHLDFDGHSMGEFQRLVLKDCGDAFIQRLEKYVTTETELQRNKSRLYLSNKVLLGLKHLKSRTS